MDVLWHAVRALCTETCDMLLRSAAEAATLTLVNELWPHGDISMLSLAPPEGSKTASHSRVYEVGAHVHWLWHFHASPCDAASDICTEEYHLCRKHKQTMTRRRCQRLGRLSEDTINPGME